jgi:excinuclease ABC subunit C
LYKDRFGKVIYIGKAKNLRKRVSSYFFNKNHDSKTRALIKNISDIDFIVTNSEVEAFLLENNLIKKYTPRYNINLKDSKSYPIIEITHDSFPRLVSSRSEKIKNEKDSRGVFGPFTSGKTRDYLLSTLNRAFKLRTCRKLPKRKCIRYDLGLCSAPCIGKISKEDYTESVEKARMVLRGKTSELLSKLKDLMKKYSDDEEYEKAIKLREEISSLKSLGERQNVERNKRYDEDIINFIIKSGKIYLLLFNSHHGILENKQSYEFNYSGDFLEEFLLMYYDENPIPKKVILPEEVSESFQNFLSSKKGSLVDMIVPQKGELKSLLELVKKNVEIQFFGNLERVKALQKILSLPSPPYVIECFDISHLSGTEVVASMVQFRNGQPDKSNYRKFKIRSFKGNDDFKAMNEVVKRRYSRLKREKEPMPDLVVIDGGTGQLNSSIKALEEINVKLQIISLAKKLEEVYIPGNSVPLRFDDKNKGLLLLRAIRDEAHRFVITFQRLRRSKRLFGKE